MAEIQSLRREVFIVQIKLCELMRFREYRTTYLHFIKSDSNRWADINRHPTDITSAVCCRRCRCGTMQMRGWSATISQYTRESHVVKLRLYSSIFFLADFPSSATFTPLLRHVTLAVSPFVTAEWRCLHGPNLTRRIHRSILFATDYLGNWGPDDFISHITEFSACN